MRTIKMALVAGAVAMMSTAAFAQGGGAVSSPASGPNPAVDANNPNAPVNQPAITNGMNTRSGMDDAQALKNERGKGGDANTQRPASDNASK
jgi:hypothetical protein